MKCWAEIIKVSTGEKRYYECDEDPKDFSDYCWTEGNFSCDCNRADFFKRAAGEKENDDEPCGDMAYRVPRLIFEDGTEIELDSALPSTRGDE